MTEMVHPHKARVEDSIKRATRVHSAVDVVGEPTSEPSSFSWCLMNVVMKNSPWLESDLSCLYLGEPITFSEAKDLQSLLVELKVYHSKSQSIKSGRQGPIPLGGLF
jgi:hypothetical protein